MNEKSGDKSKRQEICKWIFISVSLVLAVGAIAVLLYMGDIQSQRNLITINLSYVFLGIAGVLFHLMSKYRELRDLDLFELNRHILDYGFRIVQVFIYIIVLDNLLNNGEGGLKTDMVLISLFTGMFITKVEKSFESLGDRFGDMLKGMLGVSVERLSPGERIELRKQFRSELDEIRKKLAMETGRSVSGFDRTEIQKKFDLALSLLKKDKLEAIQALLIEMRVLLG
ncbi:MAG TPA: hypothetical protein ENN03_07115 [bacterium]|nr:hypothetical protein [bacterium]